MRRNYISHQNRQWLKKKFKNLEQDGKPFLPQLLALDRNFQWWKTVWWKSTRTQTKQIQRMRSMKMSKLVYCHEVMILQELTKHKWTKHTEHALRWVNVNLDWWGKPTKLLLFDRWEPTLGAEDHNQNLENSWHPQKANVPKRNIWFQQDDAFLHFGFVLIIMDDCDEFCNRQECVEIHCYNCSVSSY